MAQANVYTTATDRVIFTDKVRITTGTSPVTFQVNLVYPDASGNLYSAPPSVSANSERSIFVGVGNQLTVVGSCTIEEVGTTTSGLYSVRQI
jgi:hypothetical protein